MQKYEKSFRKTNNFSYFLIKFHLTAEYPQVILRVICLICNLLMSLVVRVEVVFPPL